jgi:CBS domain-containing protein
MTREVVTIPAALSALEVAKTYFGPTQSHRAFPVVNDRRVIGMIDRGMLMTLEPEVLDQPIGRLLPVQSRLELALPSDTCRAIAQRLAALGLQHLPVVRDAASQELIGIVTRSDLIKPARHLHEEEVHRERLVRFGR